MDTISLLSAQVKQAHQIVLGTIADLTPEQAHWKPGGLAQAAAPLLMHIAAAEDMFLNMMVGRQPLAMGAFAGKAGASEPYPMSGYKEWAERVRVDMGQFREYVAAVFKNTEDYVAGLNPDDLDRELDLTSTPIGSRMPLGAFITMTSVIHPSNHIGEVSCMKGQQGAKGYPF